MGLAWAGRRGATLAALLLAACAAPPRLAFDVTRPVEVGDWGAHPGHAMEWWYVSASSPASGLAFHWAYFTGPTPAGTRPLGLPLGGLLVGVPIAMTQVAVIDLETGERYARERLDAPALCPVPCEPPLRLCAGGMCLREGAERGRFTLDAGALQLTLTARKPRTLHPPGWSGDEVVGRMAYQSITNLAFEGTWRGRRVTGTAWMDHQWGDQVPGRDARWDWHGLHLDDGSDVMLYDLARPDGRHRLVAGSVTEADGSTRALRGVVLEPLRTWRSPRGRTYALGWSARAEGLDLEILPVREDLEFHSDTGLEFWEGPVRVRGTREGRPVRGDGMGEHFPLPR